MRRKPSKPLDYIPSATILEEQLAESQADVSRLETLLRIRRELEAAGDSPAGPKAKTQREVAQCT